MASQSGIGWGESVPTGGRKQCLVGQFVKYQTQRGDERTAVADLAALSCYRLSLTSRSGRYATRLLGVKHLSTIDLPNTKFVWDGSPTKHHSGASTTRRIGKPTESSSGLRGAKVAGVIQEHTRPN